MPAPQIEAIDEPSDSWSDSEEDPSVATATTSWSMCFDDEKATSGDDCRSSETRAKMRRQEEKLLRAISPAKGVEPRAIAQLRLLDREPSARSLLIAWRSESGTLCLASEEETADGGSGAGPQGPCIPEPRCNKVCLDISASGTGGNRRYVLAGVVASEGDVLRMTLDDGRVTTYELSGPLVPGFHEYRVFMLDLGRDLSTRVELLRGANVIAEEKQPDDVIKGMRCAEKYPVDDMPRSPDEAEKSPLAQCFERAGSK